jgi:hypothetical protein
MKFIITTGKIYLTYMTGVWGYYLVYHSEIKNQTIKYWKNNVLNN